MKYLLPIFILCCQFAFAQKPDTRFNTKFYDAVDKWVVFDKKEGEQSYSLGFIYIDPQAGFTYNYESALQMQGSKVSKLPRLVNDSNIKVRLDRNTFDVLVLTPEQVKSLGLPAEPEWLATYKVNQDFIEARVGIGSAYNAAGASHHALPILQKAYEENPHYPGLEFELAYAYNATQSFYKAVIVLNRAIENDPSNFWYYRELGFSLKHLNNLPEAEKAYRKGFELSTERDQRAEMAINMAQSYFNTKDRVKFDEWKKLVEANADPDSMFMAYIKYFEENWAKPI